MNAHAILTSHGWRGTGHTLHAHNDQIGIAKPLLVKHKKDNSGLGTSNIVSDQWWLSAIDEQLKGLDTTSGKPVQTVKTGMIGRLDRRVQRYSLYDSFVKGETLDSTIDKDKKPMAESVGPSSLANEPKSKSKSNKSKRNSPLPTPPLSCSSAMLSSSTSTSTSASPPPPRNETRDERRARKKAKQLRKIEKAAKKEAKLKRKEEKDMKRREKEEKRAKKQQRADEKSARRARKLAKRAET